MPNGIVPAQSVGNILGQRPFSAIAIQPHSIKLAGRRIIGDLNNWGANFDQGSCKTLSIDLRRLLWDKSIVFVPINMRIRHLPMPLTNCRFWKRKAITWGFNVPEKMNNSIPPNCPILSLASLDSR